MTTTTQTERMKAADAEFYAAREAMMAAQTARAAARGTPAYADLVRAEEEAASRVASAMAAIRSAYAGLSPEDAAAISDATAAVYEDVRRVPPGAVRCECGEWSGERCEVVGPAAEMITIEWMPEHLRASHVAAGNRGRWPHNGSVRSRVSRACADRMLEQDGEWCAVVE